MFDILNVATTLFLVANPVGNSPAIIALIKDFDFTDQMRIMIRETILAFVLAIFFQYFGERFLTLLEVKDYTVSLTGGILLLLVAIDMIFTHQKKVETEKLKQDPIFVPIATPMISGPGLLTMIMIFSHKVPNALNLTIAIVLAWVAISAVLISAPYLKKALKDRGLFTLEQLMGLIVTMIAMEMIVKGCHLFATMLQQGN